MKIFLIGMMGSGKSYFTKLLSKKLKVGGYDLDAIIEAFEEKSITEIFAEEGEAYFRKKESETLRWFSQKKNGVIATGGGTPCYHKNMEWMNVNGITIWINEPVKVLVERLQIEKNHRPLIKDLSNSELYNFLSEKLAQRVPFYSTAHYTVTGSSTSVNDLVKLIH
ncbi:MAG: shikimate kinase [Chitinophagaceae bacterium]